MGKRVYIVLSFAVLLAAPLAGLLCRGVPEGFFAYPPLITSRPPHAPFSWVVWSIIAALCVVTALVYLRPRVAGFRCLNSGPSPSRRFRMPVWGWAGVALTALAWLSAWQVIPTVRCLRLHMFAPLWLGYVLVMDGLVFRRQGHSMISRNLGSFLLLFPASALSWWYFEYLNRFVQNWWYEGIQHFGPWHYVVYGSLCFSTVLPAIFETQEWLCTFPRFAYGYSHGPVWTPLSRPVLVGIVLLGAVGLALLAWRPDPFFYLTWLAPLAILGGGLRLADAPTPLDELRQGNYRTLFSLAAAALVTGLFWEMWNYFSMPKWHYSIPYADAAHVFEMPVLGYAGYLPFGPICACFWTAWQRLADVRPL